MNLLCNIIQHLNYKIKLINIWKNFFCWAYLSWRIDRQGLDYKYSS